MSIVASVKVYDGIVLGAESMTQLIGEIGPGQLGLIKTYPNAKKLFQIGKFPIGALTYGAGNIGNSSMESMVAQFGKSLNGEELKPFTVEGIAKRLLEFMRKAYDERFATVPVEKRPALGLYVAGYGSEPDPGPGSEWEFVLPADSVPRPSRPDNTFGASWRGVSIPFSRLYFGHDPRVFEILQKQLGLSQDKIKELQTQLTTLLVAPVVFDGMPLNDAIGFCKFILETTIGQATYEKGAASCGGPLQIAVITREDGFQWMRRLELSA